MPGDRLPRTRAKLERHFQRQLQAFCSVVVPTWTLLAALTAGLILGALGSRLFLQSPSTVAPDAPPTPEEPAPPLPVPAAGEPEPQPVPEPEPVAEPEPEPQPQVVQEPEPPRAPPAPAPEPVRISMEDVVSELERRYQGRQADAAAEKPRPGARRRRPR